MSQDIHPGRSRDPRRDPQRQRRVDHRDIRDEISMLVRIFYMGLAVGDDRDIRHLRAGPGRGRHSH
jgi:hypothetical protein